MKYRYATFNNNEFESHKLVYSMIDSNSKVLDIGCATGYYAKELLKKDCETWGVDIDENALKIASKYCKKVVVSNLDQVNSFQIPNKYFDYVLLLDVIEHLVHPENILAIAKLHLKDNGYVIVSVPNIAHASIRWMLSKGEFQYTNTGILDNTHLHFYTKKSIGDVLGLAGYKILKLVPTNGMCKVPFIYKITDRLPTSWQYKISCLAPTLFSFQFIAQMRVR
jgi:2-polyprenyl-3-methyl-5-hydroxy-6-metoxy-1,4-benzoquinol methylase